MDKTAIKTFAIEARNQLIADVKYLAEGLGITKEKIVAAEVPAPGIEKIALESGEIVTLQDAKIKQRHSLLSRIEEVGYDQVIEEVAYTWFNRLIAVRFMEVHGYLPIRVLSSSTGKEESDLIAQAPDVDFGFTSQQISEIYELKDRNKIDELFKILFIRQCNVLNDALPGMFQKTEDYTELLFPLQYTNPNGVIRKLLSSISEEDFSSVEIIGWMYQYYNTELNESVYDGTLKRCRIPKDLLPAATTIYTPDWAIKYMVDNSLGKIWLEGHHNDILKSKLSYYLEDLPQNAEIQRKFDKLKVSYSELSPESIKFLDPCMGSGHILVYAFDVLMQIYESVGYQKSDAARLILEKNLYGLDIDDRAGQLAYFAIMMKAREYNRKVFSEHIKPHLCSIQESNIISDTLLSQIANGDNASYQNLSKLKHIFIDAKEYGSILTVDDQINFSKLKSLIENPKILGLIRYESGYDRLIQIILQGEILSKKYEVVVTNPPYFGSDRFSIKLSEYVKENYLDTRSDLSMVMYRHVLSSLSSENGYVAFITTNSWFFITSFEKIRNEVITNIDFDSIVDFGTELFDGKVGHNKIVSWVNRHSNINNKFIAIRLIDYCYARRDEKEKEYFNINNRYCADKSNFSKIPGTPVAYWITQKVFNLFEKLPSLSIYCDVKQGLATADNNRFLRLWYEVNYQKAAISSLSNPHFRSYKWYPHNKGGDYRKWYGNIEYLINWEKDGDEIRNFKDDNGKLRSVIRNSQFFFKEGITWSDISSSSYGARYMRSGCIFDTTGPTIFTTEDKLYPLLGYLNSIVYQKILDIMCPGLHYSNGTIAKSPISEDLFISHNCPSINKIVRENVLFSQNDWDSFETSWDFHQHPFFTHKGRTVEESFKNWQSFAEQQFNQLKANEEKLNRIFIEIYGLQDELTPEEEDKDVTIRKADLQRDVKSFLSYAVGCMFGRYSLDTPGLVYAGGEFNPSKYPSFPADDDGIIPITDREYFEDDIVGRFIEFLKVTYGENTLEENLAFIAGALKTKGATPREAIRNYFLKDFYADHLKIYQKRPIYWLFDSGKQNGFKALIYLHRYNRDTVGRVRTDYLHETQKKIDAAIQRAEYFKANGTPVQQRKATDEISTLTKQLEETKKYDEALATIALQRIELDLDDGVKVNYEKFQNVDVGGEGKMKKTIDLLGKIK